MRKEDEPLAAFLFYICTIMVAVSGYFVLSVGNEASMIVFTVFSYCLVVGLGYFLIMIPVLAKKEN